MQPEGTVAAATSLNVRVLSDIPYLGAKRSEKLDVYLPHSKSWPGLRPAVIMIHGGGWAIGDKATSREIDIGTTLAQNGYAVFSINYKLDLYKQEAWKSPLVRRAWPENFQDCRASIEFVRREADTYSVNPEQIALLGTSAGGHLALLTALAPASLHPGDLSAQGSEASGEINPYRISCVISLYGIHDLHQFGGESFVSMNGDRIGIEEASPVRYFAQNGPPVLIIHGDKDETVKPSIARDMAIQLSKHGIVNELVWVPGAGHSFHLHPEEMNLEPVVVDFLNRYLALKKQAPLCFINSPEDRIMI